MEGPFSTIHQVQKVPNACTCAVAEKKSKNLSPIIKLYVLELTWASPHLNGTS